MSPTRQVSLTRQVRQLRLLLLLTCCAPRFALTLLASPTRTSPTRSTTPLTMLARKAFKGGSLDDFLSAGDAEAKYGPRRYAAVADDAWKLQVKAERSEVEKERSAKVYAALKRQLLADHAFLSAVIGALLWAVLPDPLAATSYAVGAALGGLYLYLLQRQTDSFGGSPVEVALAGPPPVVIPVLMVLAVAKNPGALALVPTLGGFATTQLATLAQAIYPSDFGLSPTEPEPRDGSD